MYARSAGNSADQLRRVVPCRWSAPETTHDTVEAAQRTLPAPRYVPKDAKILPVPWYMLPSTGQTQCANQEGRDARMRTGAGRTLELDLCVRTSDSQVLCYMLCSSSTSRISGIIVIQSTGFFDQYSPRRGTCGPENTGGPFSSCGLAIGPVPG